MAASRLLAVNQIVRRQRPAAACDRRPGDRRNELFGGRGSVWSALLGALVIGSISNGMDLLASQSSVKYMVTGAVLLLAVFIDALAKQQRQTRGRA